MLLPFWSIALATGIAAGVSSGSPAGCRCLAAGGARRAGAGAPAARCPGRRAARLWRWARRSAAERRSPVRLSAALERAAESGREVDGARPVGPDGPVRAGPATSRASAWLADLVGVEGAAARGRLLVNLRPGRGACSPAIWCASAPGWPDRPGWPIPGCPIPRCAARGLRHRPRRDARPAARPLSWSGRAPALVPRRLAQRAHVALAAAIEPGRAGPVAAGSCARWCWANGSPPGRRSEAAFKAAGAVHVLSVSGLHLTAMAAFCSCSSGALLIGVPAPGPARAHRGGGRPAVPAGPGVLHAPDRRGGGDGARGADGGAGLRRGRRAAARPRLASAIAGAAAVMLLRLAPAAARSSFQLSFAGVIAPGAGGAGLALRTRIARQRRPSRPSRRWLTRGAAASVAAFLVTAPLCAHHFAELAPAVPAGQPAAGPAARARRLAARAWPAASSGRFTPRPVCVPLQLAGALAAALALAGGRLRAVGTRWSPVRQPRPRRDRPAAAGGAARPGGRGRTRRSRAGCWPAAWRWPSAPERIADPALAAEAGPRVAGDVPGRRPGGRGAGGGPGGFVMLIDGGGAVSGTLRSRCAGGGSGPAPQGDPSANRSGGALASPSRSHERAVSPARSVSRSSALWTPGEGGGNPEYDRLIALAPGARRDRRRAAHVRAGAAGGPGAWTDARAGRARAARAERERRLAGAAGRLRRAMVPVLRRHRGAGGGGAGGASAAADPLRSDVLKVPHHGSRTSSSDELLDAVGPVVWGWSRLAAATASAFRAQKSLRGTPRGA